MLPAKKSYKNISKNLKKKKNWGTLKKISFDWKPGPGVKTKFPKTRNDIPPLQEEADLREAQVKHVRLLSHANLP